MTPSGQRPVQQMILDRTWPVVLDILIFAAILAIFYGILTIAHYWLGQAVAVTEISRSPWSLPRYAFYSLVRMALAYFLSLLFADHLWLYLPPTIADCSRSWSRSSTSCNRFPC